MKTHKIYTAPAVEPQHLATRALLRILGLAALFALTGCKQEQKTADVPAPKVQGEEVTLADDAPQETSLSVETAEPRKLAITHLTGRLYWNEDATVRIFTPVAGRVQDVLGDVGQSVPVGMPLARIDSPDFGQALADARTAEGNLRLAQTTADRSKELLDHGAAAQKDVENAEAALTSARAERDRAEARLALYGGSDNDSRELYLLRSPLAGVLVEKNINPGQEVRADQMLANATQLFAPLFVVSDPTHLWVQLDVAESDLGSLQPGQTLRIHSRAYPDTVFDGILQKIGDSLDPATRTVQVRGSVANPDKLLKAEMYVTVDVEQEAGSVAQAGVEIPSKAIFMKNNQYYLFIQKAPGQYRRQSVRIGVEQDGKVQVFDGVAPGQKVVTEGCLLLQALLDSAGNS
jgi:cobalt-zinc-cadmium efflux system membrane fusion protein